ncbi:hypothetical protein [Rhodoferax ferrireducens]|uniref:hypothetical protein n=1 Tax=Rhodoferax ferrireducens TaxID=192843 RepID=UPI00140FC151|nr:hypothetical protein [Rhodoferax ferrireducens]
MQTSAYFPPFKTRPNEAPLFRPAGRERGWGSEWGQERQKHQPSPSPNPLKPTTKRLRHFDKSANAAQFPDLWTDAHAQVHNLQLLTREATRHGNYFPQLKITAP